MRLDPQLPPGRSSRKARAFAGEIARLRVEGYSFAAIRQALADTGVTVSKTTVQREAARGTSTPVVSSAASTPTQTHAAPAAPAKAAPAPAHMGTTPPLIPLAQDSRTGRDIAREFVEGHVTNPLLRAREQR